MTGGIAPPMGRPMDRAGPSPCAMTVEPRGTPGDLRSRVLIAKRRGDAGAADRVRAAACLVEEALSRGREGCCMGLMMREAV